MTETAPHNPTAEEAVVGAVINMPELFDTLAPLLGEEGVRHFTSTAWAGSGMPFRLCAMPTRKSTT